MLRFKISYNLSLGTGKDECRATTCIIAKAMSELTLSQRLIYNCKLTISRFINKRHQKLNICGFRKIQI